MTFYFAVMAYFIFCRTFSSCMSITSTPPTFISTTCVSVSSTCGRFSSLTSVGVGISSLSLIVTRTIALLSVLHCIEITLYCWFTVALQHFLLLVNGFTLANSFFCFSRVRAGSSCSFSESELSRIPTTNRSLIISSFISP